MTRFAALLALLVLPAGLSAREIVCPQTIVTPHAAPLIAQPQYAQPILAQPYYAAPLVAPATHAGTVYGYSAEPLRANAYHVDPAEIVREAARLVDGSQSLARQSLEVYGRFGTDALGMAAATEQLRARAALIEATRPDAAGLVAPLRSGPQALTAGGATICVEPDGAGGFTIRVSPTGSASPPPAAPEPIDTPPATSAPPTGDVPEGVRTLAARCASCHTAPNAKGGLELFADARTLNPIDETLAKSILSAALAGTMPPTTDASGRPLAPLDDREIATLRLLLERP